MTQFGYTGMCEQTPVRQLVSDLQAAEQAGFDFSVISDLYYAWLEDQGHSGDAWAVRGAAAQATSQLPLMTMVTCPTFRYHPALAAQKAATAGVLPENRFTLGLGTGETPTSTWPAVAGPLPGSVISGWAKQPRSSAPSSPASTSASAAATSRWNAPGSTTCPIPRYPSGSRYPARTPSTSPQTTPTA